ncbi:alpha-protein kinase 3 isoform X1 [Synchiropus splendidus]|uniref:alpha-protein kinase 3 isoform X1 n=1 Tax=Synchiropus splendidus TaxID=270530 RepID=UPI00237DAAB0|nr:alpha-protein kinase 3 isoform X1 [Synchiropus splendidus]
MTSRRPMTRSFSSNGRTSSFNEEDNGSANGRPESRNTYLSNVRPENRSTLCTVMAQLTEDIQPSFDTTLKSKAVSENCNVKFTCVVSGYPAPELKWYKDDMEMDRYCGLPKYEIRRNGKTHTLQIYNCSLDDAAIYQVSACNSKGIVSCSGVLEVGTMNEYQIHQRFFAKLKQKAEKKKKEVEEQTKKKDEGKDREAKAKVSPERPPRKRPISHTAPAVKEPEAAEQPVAETNGMPPEVTEAAPETSVDNAVEKEKPPSEETLVQKKIKVTNGVDAGVNKADNCYDGGISLAQFLAQTLQSQAAEEKQNPSQTETPLEMDSAVEKEDAPERTLRMEEEQETREEKDRSSYQEKEEERPSRTTEHPKHHGKARKDHEHHHLQASLSSMLHSVKDFFFGKGKKDSHHPSDSKESYLQPSPPQTPPSYQLHAEQISEPQKPDISVPMVIDEPHYPTEDVATEQHEDGSQDRPLQLDSPEAHKSPHEDLRPSTGQNDKDVPVVTMEASVGAEINAPGEDMALSGPQVSTEQVEENVSPLVPEVAPQHDPVECLVSHPAAKEESSVKDHCSPQCDEVPMEQFPPIGIIKDLPIITISEMDSEVIVEAAVEEKVGPEDERLTGENLSCGELDVEEKAEVKSSQEPRSAVEVSVVTSLDSLIEMAELTEPEIPGQALLSLNEVEQCEAKVEATIPSLINEMHSAPAAEVSVQKDDTVTVEEDKIEVSLENEREASGGESMTVVENVASVSDLEEAEDVGNNVRKGEQLEVMDEPSGEENKEVNEKKTETQTYTDKTDDSTGVSEGDVMLTSSLKDNEEQRTSSDKQLPVATPQVDLNLDISSIEDVNQIKPRAIPKCDLLDPGMKESMLPLTILALNKKEMETSFLPKHDATEALIQDMTVADSLGLLSKQKGMQDNEVQSEKVKLSQSDERVEEEPAGVKRELPRVNSIPVINVSCSDDIKVEELTDVFDAPLVEAPTPTLTVVPPISVTCPESDGALPKPELCESGVTETGAVTRSGTEDDVSNHLPTKPHSTERQAGTVEKLQTDESVSGPTQISPAKPDSALPMNKVTDSQVVTDVLKNKPAREGKTDSFMTVEDLLKTRSSERLCFKPPIMPSLSPSSLRKFKPTPESENEAGTVPVITVDDRPGDKAEDDLSGGSTPTSSLSCESSPRLKRRDSLSLIRSATPEELASGARRKIFIPKTKDDADGIADVKSPYMSPSQARRAALLQAPMGQKTPPMERRSPLMSRRKATLDVPKVVEEPVKTPPEEKPAEKKLDPLKAPQVIRKIRGEPFPDASGHLKLWCQFFNVLSDATIKWYRDEEEILEVNRSGGDESQVALAIVLASSKDCGVYGCTINNEYGSDTTDFLLSEDILAEILLRDDLEVGEEIEMTPLLFTKGLANSGSWGEKYFGRIMTETANVGEGWCHKASKVRVIYGLNPIFESGSNCIMKVQNPIAYGTKQESNLAERNLEITKQECKTQNMIREYCKIFAAEARVQENFGCGLEVIPQYLMYRPANSVPYATVEEELSGVFLKYSTTDAKGRLILRSVSEMEQKCCTFQHWIHEWTHGNLLVTRLEGVGTKLTNVRVVTKNKGYQGLTERGSPEVFDQFLAQHQCNYYCGLLSLRPLKSMDSLQQPAKMKGSRSPLLNRKVGSGSGSPQLQRKGQSPQLSRKTNSSPRVSRKVQETEDNKSDVSPAGDGTEPR